MQKTVWKPTYKNASTPGLIGDGSKEVCKTSVTKEIYSVQCLEKLFEGSRKEHVRKCIQETVINEMKEELRIEMEVEPVTKSIYREHFNASGFSTKALTESLDDKLIEQYPLNKDAAKSVYLDQLSLIKRSETISKDPAKAFRKSSFFARPFYAELE